MLKYLCCCFDSLPLERERHCVPLLHFILYFVRCAVRGLYARIKVVAYSYVIRHCRVRASVPGWHRHLGQAVALFPHRRGLGGCSQHHRLAHARIIRKGAVYFGAASFLFFLLSLSAHSCSARAKRTLFFAKSARTLTHFILWTHFTFSRASFI